MADIINLADRRKKDPPSIHKLIEDAIDLISSEWERFAKVNRLNDYFIETAGVWTEAGVNYLSDLNAISAVENKIGISIIVTAPFGGHLGWRASFPIKSGTVTTPDLPFETYARCFNILLHLKLKRDLLANGYSDEL